MLIDTHAHLNFNAYRDDADKVIWRSLNNNIWIINVGTNYQTSKKAVEIAQKYKEGIFASVGLHPINLDTGLVRLKRDSLEGSFFEKEFDFEKYKKLAKSPKVIAIGEIGLDYYWRPKTTKKKELFKQKQKELLLQQLELAKELNLPVIFHCRLAHDDLLDFLNNYTPVEKLRQRGVIHGFVGTIEQLEKYLEMGFYIGFNGIIFKNIEGIDFEKLIQATPLEKILVETDCPYLSPPNFSSERNEPFGVKFILEKIAKIKNIPLEKMMETTTENAKRLFKI